MRFAQASIFSCIYFHLKTLNILYNKHSKYVKSINQWSKHVLKLKAPEQHPGNHSNYPSNTVHLHSTQISFYKCKKLSLLWDLTLFKTETRGVYWRRVKYTTTCLLLALDRRTASGENITACVGWDDDGSSQTDQLWNLRPAPAEPDDARRAQLSSHEPPLPSCGRTRGRIWKQLHELHVFGYLC